MDRAYDIVDDPQEGSSWAFLGWMLVVLAVEAWRSLAWKVSRGGMGK